MTLVKDNMDELNTMGVEEVFLDHNTSGRVWPPWLHQDSPCLLQLFKY